MTNLAKDIKVATFCIYRHVSHLKKAHTQKPTFTNCIHSVALFVLLATLASHCDKMPRLQVCVVSATICGQRVAVGEEMDGVGKVMDTGSKAYIHLALVTIVSVPVFLA